MTDPITLMPLDHTQPLGPVPGWYGKMPCMGDFASRRLPPEFIESWDAWLQRSIASSRQQLGDAWLDLFLTSPMWRFALSPGVCGDSLWAGLLIPSVDKVGRSFPLTLAVPLTREDADVLDLFAADDWYVKLEEIALSALNVEFSADELEHALAVCPFPLDDTVRPGHSASREIGGWLSAATPGPFAFDLPGDASLAGAMNGAARALFAESTAGKTFWWSVSDGATASHCSAGLPAEDYYAVLLGAARSPVSSPDSSDTLSADPMKAFGFEQTSDEPAS